MQDCSSSSLLAVELLQSCNKPIIYVLWDIWKPDHQDSFRPVIKDGTHWDLTCMYAVVKCVIMGLVDGILGLLNLNQC